MGLVHRAGRPAETWSGLPEYKSSLTLEDLDTGPMAGYCPLKHPVERHSWVPQEALGVRPRRE